MSRIALLIVLTLCFRSLGSAQTCTGNLGDPVLNETFGTGNYHLKPGETTFNYEGGCPSKGNYTISGFLFGCGNRTWVQMVGDHTPNDLNGNYMMVNAESTPGVIYMDTAKNLCGNTVYQFGMWVTPVMTHFSCDGNAVLPNIKYQLKTLAGVTLAIDSTGNLPIVNDRDWRFYGFTVTTPPGLTDIIVNITINPPYGCGSGFAIDDITLSPCGPTISALIDGSPGPAEVCADYTNPFVMTAAYSPGFADPVVQWQMSVDSGRTWTDITGATTLTYSVPHRTSGAIMYRICIAERANINSVNCRVTSNAIYTAIHPVPAHAPPRTLIGCLGKDFHFPQADPRALEVLWTGPGGYNSTSPNPVIPTIQYSDSGLYKLKETFYYNCVSLDTFYLKIFPGTTVSVEPSYPICEGQSELLLASATDSVGFLWIPSTGLSNNTIPNPLASPRDSVIYKIYATNKYGCTDSASVTIDVYRNPVANAGIDKVILRGDTAILNGIATGTSVNYNWSPSNYLNDAGLITPLAYPPVTGTYTLQVVSTVGCGSVSDEVEVKVYNDFFIPNAFTPNGDGINDKFQIPLLDNYRLTHFTVYNRWGEIVFNAQGSRTDWDGKFKGLPQPHAVYVYFLELVSPTGKKITRRGTVMLIR